MVGNATICMGRGRGCTMMHPYIPACLQLLLVLVSQVRCAGTGTPCYRCASSCMHVVRRLQVTTWVYLNHLGRSWDQATRCNHHAPTCRRFLLKCSMFPGVHDVFVWRVSTTGPLHLFGTSLPTGPHHQRSSNVLVSTCACPRRHGKD